MWPGGVMVSSLDPRLKSPLFCFNVTTLGKLLTNMCLCQRAVQFGTGWREVKPYGREGNRSRPDVALAMRHRLKWVGYPPTSSKSKEGRWAPRLNVSCTRYPTFNNVKQIATSGEHTEVACSSCRRRYCIRTCKTSLSGFPSIFPPSLSPALCAYLCVCLWLGWLVRRPRHRCARICLVNAHPCRLINPT